MIKFVGTFRTFEDTQLIRIEVEKVNMVSVLSALEVEGIDFGSEDEIEVADDLITAEFPEMEGELYLERDND